MAMVVRRVAGLDLVKGDSSLLRPSTGDLRRHFHKCPVIKAQGMGRIPEM